MNIKKMKEISTKRTSGKWNIIWGNYDNEYEVEIGAKIDNSSINLSDGDIKFLLMAANNWDKLMAVVEAAKNLQINITSDIRRDCLWEALEKLENEDE